MAAGSTPPAGGWAGIKVFDPDRDPRGRKIPGWPSQIGALTFDREGLRVLGCDWNLGGILASADPVDGTVAFERVLPVTDFGWWPRGDFAFSRDGGRLAAPTRRDRTVVGVWDVALGPAVVTLRGSGGPVTAVAFGPDGRSLATAAVGAAGRAADRDPLGPGLGPGDPDLRGGAGPGRGPRLQRRRPPARGGAGAEGRPGLGRRLGHRDGGRARDPGPRRLWSSSWRSTRMGPGSPSRITGG